MEQYTLESTRTKLVCLTDSVLFISITDIKPIGIILIVNPCKTHRNSFNSKVIVSIVNTCKELIVIVSLLVVGGENLRRELNVLCPISINFTGIEVIKTV